MKLRPFDLEVLAAIERASMRPTAIMGTGQPLMMPRALDMAEICGEIIGPEGKGLSRWQSFRKLRALVGSSLEAMESSGFVESPYASTRLRLTFTGRAALNTAKSAQS